MDTNEQLERTLIILEKLANGINPVDDTILTMDNPINNVEITRALFFAISQLKEPVKSSKKRKNFYVEESQLAKFEYDEKGIYLTQIVEKLNNLIDINKAGRLTRPKMLGWLIDIGILTAVRLGDGKNKRHMPTDEGLNMGLKIVKFEDKHGNPFDAVKYPLSMQKFIIDNIDGLYNWIANRKK